jgi:hypothetical protein
MSLRLVAVAIAAAVLAVPLVAGPAAAALRHKHYDAVDVTTTSTQVLAAKNDRRVLILQNDSDTIVYCAADGTAAVVGKGIRLNAAGGNWHADVAAPTDVVNCIHNGVGNKKVMPTEDQ